MTNPSLNDLFDDEDDDMLVDAMDPSDQPGEDHDKIISKRKNMRLVLDDDDDNSKGLYSLDNEWLYLTCNVLTSL